MNKHKHSIGMTLIFLGVGCFLQGTLLPRLVLAAGASAVSEQALTKEVSQMEHRFFAREYANDPMEKRLERLELMVFGGTQDGAPADRYARLTKAIVARSEHPAAAGSKPTTGAPATNLQSSAHYPVLKTLEWRAFKKTFPDDTLANRLSRLEKKTFGVDNTAMSYIDRVDRLKKTLGVDASPQQPVAAAPSIVGPAPRARAHGQSSPDMWSFGSPQMRGNDFFSDDDDGMPAMPNMPGMTIRPGFGMGMGSMGLSGTIGNMLRDMDRQMAQMQQMPSGAYVFDQKTGEWVEQFSGKRVKPPAAGASPFMQKLPTEATPFKTPKLMPLPQQHNYGELPPYSDPNSI